MTFSYRKVIQNLNLVLDNVPIVAVEQFNFLGLTIDRQLSWKFHINKIALKLTRTNFVLNKLKRFVPIEILRIMYFSLIQSHLNFGILHWGHTIKDTDILSKMQKRAVRIITNSTYRCHTTPLFKQMDINKLVDIFKFFETKVYLQSCK